MQVLGIVIDRAAAGTESGSACGRGKDMNGALEIKIVVNLLSQTEGSMSKGCSLGMASSLKQHRPCSEGGALLGVHLFIHLFPEAFTCSFTESAASLASSPHKHFCSFSCVHSPRDSGDSSMVPRAAEGPGQRPGWRGERGPDVLADITETLPHTCRCRHEPGLCDPGQCPAGQGRSSVGGGNLVPLVPSC